MAAGPNFAKKTHLWSKLNMPGDNKIDRRGIANIDGRTKLGRIHRAFKRALIEELKGKPSIIERSLIERAAMLHLKCMMLDEKIASGRDLNEMETNHYLAWTNALGRTLMHLRVRDVDDILRMRAKASYARALR